MAGGSLDLWLVWQLGRRSLATGSLRDYWPGLARYDEGAGAATRAIAAVVWVVLVAVVAARRRRLIGRAIDGVVRAVVAGIEVPAAVRRAVEWLEWKGIDPEQGRADLERLLGGFLSSAPGSTRTDARGTLSLARRRRTRRRRHDAAAPSIR